VKVACLVIGLCGDPNDLTFFQEAKSVCLAIASSRGVMGPRPTGFKVCLIEGGLVDGADGLF
jgi:hypothetical protein